MCSRKVNPRYIPEPNIFLRICTHTQTITISSDLSSLMPTHSMTCVHPYSSMLFKLRPCIKNLCNVHYPPTPSLGWIGQNKRSFIVVSFSPERLLVSVFPASKKFDSDLELDVGMHKTNAHPCPPMNNNTAPMPTQNPWAWAPN